MRQTILCLLSLCLTVSCSGPHPTATYLIRGGTVYTEPGVKYRHLDILTGGQKILKVGENLTAPAGCRVLNLQDYTVYPGFVDAHAHLAGFGQTLSEIDLRDVQSYDELVNLVHRKAGVLKPGEWVKGRGWDQNQWPGGAMPEHEAFSDLFPDNPVFLKRVDGHAVLVNLAAMALAGIGPETPDPEGGEILRHSDGTPTGILVDRAMDLVGNHMPEPDLSMRKQHLLVAMERYASLGVTSVHDAGVDPATLDAYLELERNGEMNLFVNIMLDDEADMDGFIEEWFQKGAYESSWLRIGTVKLYADGAMGSRGAWLWEDYGDRPGHRGLNVTPLEHIRMMCDRSLQSGFQVAVHCIGDRAVSEIAAIYYDTAHTGDSPRFRIEHLQLFRPGTLSVIKNAGTIASMQPYHYVSDLPWVEDRIGSRIRHAYAWKEVIMTKIPLCFGTDCPVESPDPIPGIWVALNPERGLTSMEVMRACTLGGHYAAFQEHKRGLIQTGYSADFTVLSQDILSDSVDPSAIKSILTMVNGKMTHGGNL